MKKLTGDCFHTDETRKIWDEYHKSEKAFMEKVSEIFINCIKEVYGDEKKMS